MEVEPLEFAPDWPGDFGDVFGEFVRVSTDLAGRVAAFGAAENTTGGTGFLFGG